MRRVFGNRAGDRGSIPSRVIPKTHERVLEATLLNSQNYKVRFKGKWSNTGKRIFFLGVVAIGKGAFGLPLTTVGQLIYICIYSRIYFGIFLRKESAASVMELLIYWLHWRETTSRQALLILCLHYIYIYIYIYPMINSRSFTPLTLSGK